MYHVHAAVLVKVLSAEPKIKPLARTRAVSGIYAGCTMECPMINYFRVSTVLPCFLTRHMYMYFKNLNPICDKIVTFTNV